MLVDWFTVGAQVLNFLILVGLMKHFLYQPILNAIDAREARIAKELAEAAATQAAADAQSLLFAQKNEAFDAERAGLLAAATDAAHTERQRLIEAARAAAVVQKTRINQSLKQAADSLNKDIRQQAQTSVFAVARHTLRELTDTALEQRATAVFINRLQQIDPEVSQQLSLAITDPEAPALLRSAFPLTGEQQAQIKDALNRSVSADVPLRFETAPHLICGIELSTTGFKLAWSIADHLTSLEQNLSETLTGARAGESSTDSANGHEAEAGKIKRQGSTP